MNNFGFWTTKTVEPDAPPFGTGRIILAVSLKMFRIEEFYFLFPKGTFFLAVRIRQKLFTLSFEVLLKYFDSFSR